MKPLEIADVLDLVEYEKRRDDYLPRVIDYKRTRRVQVGEELTFVFENRETMRFQIQEMTRAERTVDDAGIQAELDAYNELIPAEHALSATLMIEITQDERIRETLDRLIGIDENVFLLIGEQRVQGEFDARQFEDDRISAVQYLRFPLGTTLAERFRDAVVPVHLRVEHPNLTAETAIDGIVRASLAQDLGEKPLPNLLADA